MLPTQIQNSAPSSIWHSGAPFVSWFFFLQTSRHLKHILTRIWQKRSSSDWYCPLVGWVSHGFPMKCQGGLMTGSERCGSAAPSRCTDESYSESEKRSTCGSTASQLKLESGLSPGAKKSMGNIPIFQQLYAGIRSIMHKYLYFNYNAFAFFVSDRYIIVVIPRISP